MVPSAAQTRAVTIGVDEHPSPCTTSSKRARPPGSPSTTSSSSARPRCWRAAPRRPRRRGWPPGGDGPGRRGCGRDRHQGRGRPGWQSRTTSRRTEVVRSSTTDIAHAAAPMHGLGAAVWLRSPQVAGGPTAPGSARRAGVGGDGDQAVGAHGVRQHPAHAEGPARGPGRAADPCGARWRRSGRYGRSTPGRCGLLSTSNSTSRLPSRALAFSFQRSSRSRCRWPRVASPPGGGRGSQTRHGAGGGRWRRALDHGPHPPGHLSRPPSDLGPTTCCHVPPSSARLRHPGSLKQRLPPRSAVTAAVTATALLGSAARSSAMSGAGWGQGEVEALGHVAAGRRSSASCSAVSTPRRWRPCPGAWARLSTAVTMAVSPCSPEADHGQSGRSSAGPPGKRWR